MGYAERKTATNVRLAEEAFYGTSHRVASLTLPDIADATRAKLYTGGQSEGSHRLASSYIRKAPSALRFPSSTDPSAL